MNLEQARWSNPVSYAVAEFAMYRFLPAVARLLPLDVVVKLTEWSVRKSNAMVARWVFASPSDRVSYAVYPNRRFGLNGIDQYDLVADMPISLKAVCEDKVRKITGMGVTND